MTIRLKKWFTLSDIPGSPDPNLKYGVYHRTIPGSNPPITDPSREGKNGQTYIVELYGAKASALFAPCPDFCNDEETGRGKPRYSEKELSDLTKLIGQTPKLISKIKTLKKP